MAYTSLLKPNPNPSPNPYSDPEPNPSPYKVDVAYTSLLKRAQQTLDIVLKITGQEDVPVHQARP